jgi:hypothetical protein
MARKATSSFLVTMMLTAEFRMMLTALMTMSVGSKHFTTMIAS